MDDILLGTKGKAALEGSLKTKNPLQIVGIYLGEERMYASRLEWNQNVSRAPKSSRMVTPISFAGQRYRKVEWRGVHNFIVPPDYVEFQCVENCTYGEYFSAFIKDAVIEIKKMLSASLMTVFFQCPERLVWQKAKNEYCDFLNRIFSDAPGIIPGVLPSFPEAYAGYYYSDRNRKDTLLMVHIDKTWTELTLVNRGNQVLKKTAAAFGYDREVGMNVPLDLRINDYVHNSTASWTGRQYSSWKEGFLEVCTGIQSGGWVSADEADIMCAGDIFPLVRECIMESGLAISGTDIHLVDNPSYCITNFAFKIIEKMAPVPTNLPRKTGVRTDELFEL